MAKDRSQDTSIATIEFLYDHLKDVLERQVRDEADLDSKMGQIFAADSLLIGLLGLGMLKGGPSVILGLLALGVYLFIAVQVMRHLTPVKMLTARHADSLWRDFRTYEPWQIKERLVERIAGDYVTNDATLKSKATRVQLVLGATAVLAPLVGLALVLRAVG